MKTKLWWGTIGVFSVISAAFSEPVDVRFGFDEPASIEWITGERIEIEWQEIEDSRCATGTGLSHSAGGREAVSGPRRGHGAFDLPCHRRRVRGDGGRSGARTGGFERHLVASASFRSDRQRSTGAGQH